MPARATPSHAGPFTGAAATQNRYPAQMMPLYAMKAKRLEVAHLRLPATAYSRRCCCHVERWHTRVAPAPGPDRP